MEEDKVTTEYPDNSDTVKAPEPKAIAEPKSVAVKKHSFFATDMKTAGKYVYKKVILPGCKSLLLSAINSIASELLGEDTYRTVSGTKLPVDNISYNSMFKGGKIAGSGSGRYTPVEYDIKFTSSEDAKRVLDGLRSKISRYGSVRVSELYELARVQYNNYLLDDYGWTSLNYARVIAIPDGYYMIDFPKAIPLKSVR